MDDQYRFVTTLAGIDWDELKATLARDSFDNGRTPDELRRSFAHSFAAVLAYSGKRIIGSARALSDGVCNAYLVDVWTYTPHRRRGVATQMLRMIEGRLDGQHIALFGEHAETFYRRAGYAIEQGGMSKVVGAWLRHARDT